MSYPKTKQMNLEDGQTLLAAVDGKMSDLKSAISDDNGDVATDFLDALVSASWTRNDSTITITTNGDNTRWIEQNIIHTTKSYIIESVLDAVEFSILYFGSNSLSNYTGSSGWVKKVIIPVGVYCLLGVRKTNGTAIAKTGIYQAIKNAAIANISYSSLKVDSVFYGNGKTIDFNVTPENSIRMFNSAATIQNAPTGFSDWMAGGTWAVDVYAGMNKDDHFMYEVIHSLNDDASKRKAIRAKNSGTWGNWSIIDGNDPMYALKTDNDFGQTGTIDCNSLSDNTVKLFNSDATLQNGPPNFNDISSGGTWAITTYKTLYNGNNYKYQTITKMPCDPKKRMAVRAYYNNAWGNWSIIYGVDNARAEIKVGEGQQYTRLRDGIAAAYSAQNADVYVYPGTYDLVTEFAEEIAAATGETGIVLGYNMRVIFYDGAKVTALFDNSESTYDATTWAWIYEHFQPFYAGFGAYVIENLNIEAKDCRYCVHDERDGEGTYRHEYINCRMKYTNTHSDVHYVQCIGGGLGKHGTVVIDGGCYESVPNYGIPSTGNDKDTAQIPISFHNGYASGCDSSIFIKDVYLKDKGYFRFGWFGASTIESNVQICGCGMGLPILVKSEIENNTGSRNFELTEFNNDLRKASHWVLGSDPYYATLVND